MQNKIRVMIVDKSIVFRAGLRRVLEEVSEIDIVRDSGDPREALRGAIQFQPQVTLLGQSPSIQDSYFMTRSFSTKTHTRVIVLDPCPCETHMQEAFRAGAFGYFSKGIEASDLVHAIRRVARGQRASLSARELQVLRLVVDGQSVREIADSIHTREKRVGKVLHSAIRKLDGNNRTHAVVRAIYLGWLFLGEPGSANQAG